MSIFGEIAASGVGAALGSLGGLAKDLREAIVGKEMTPEIIADLQKKAIDLELATQNAQMEMIKAEASSADPWTSRARPSFMYVVYILLLWSLPMGLATVFWPERAMMFTVGFKAWLAAIPVEILQLFGVVATGYVAGRSWEKVKGVTK